MARTCTVCHHPDRPAIDLALVSGASGNAVAAKHRVSEDAVVRHRLRHIPATLAQSHQAEELSRANDLAAQLAACRTTARRIGDKAEADGDYRAAIGAIRELVRIVELQAKLLGALDDRPQINLLVSPEWLAVRSALLVALQPFPEARQAVADRLLVLEASA